MKRSPLADSNRGPPPYHWRLPWVAGGCGSAYSGRLRPYLVCDRLPAVAPAWLHKRSILMGRTADGGDMLDAGSPWGVRFDVLAAAVYLAIRPRLTRNRS